MRLVFCACGVSVVLALAVSPYAYRSVMAGDKSGRAESAKELGKTWRYPESSNDIEVGGPLGEKLKNLDRTTMQFSKPKASFEDVWNFYAAKCGFARTWKKDLRHLVIEQAEGKGQRMVIDRGEETEFGLFTEQYVVHVQIRKVDDAYTDVRILTTLR
jgi:hypothetical protein